MTQESEARPATDTAAALEEALKTERDKADSYLNNWRRAEADLQNYKRRTDQEKGELIRYGSAPLIKELLGVLDDLERALASAGDQDSPIVQGVELTRRNFVAALERYGVSEIPALGETFDPNLHEAVMQAPGAENKVITVIKKGYRLHDRILRPAMVAVGTGEPAAAEQPAAPATDADHPATLATNEEAN
ncbi:MAG: nucleotide exchange factor GrpE [Chloroflexota bacterium]|nr:nucleotide exchange factor GrpE [Dehalococcoidia bacterium]MDW8252450.1 nucleotide exchange factor GrpE [Chloroflexota bacterium]